MRAAAAHSQHGEDEPIETNEKAKHHKLVGAGAVYGCGERARWSWSARDEDEEEMEVSVRYLSTAT